MIRFSYIWALLVLAVFLWRGNAAGASPPPQKILTIISAANPEHKNTSPLHLTLQEGENTLKASIRFNVPPAKQINKDVKAAPSPEEPGGHYELFIDDLLVATAAYTGTAIHLTQDIPVLALQNGEHRLRCALRAPDGEVHSAEVDFSFHGSPQVAMTDLAVDTSGMLDAEVTAKFFGMEKEFAGAIEITIDQQLLGIASLKPEQNAHKVALAQLLGKPLSVGHLPPGTHLLTLRAHGVNGNSTLLHRSFSINTAPSLDIARSKDGALQGGKANFAKGISGYSGAVEIYHEGELLLSKREEGTVIALTRKELDDALQKKRRQPPPNENIPLIFALRAANGMENWQVVEIGP